MKKVTWEEFSAAYCERQEQTPEGLLDILRTQKARFGPDGWMMLECQVLDSSRLGSLAILPYGPRNSFKGPPAHPISLRGLASDMSVVVMLLAADQLPQEK